MRLRDHLPRVFVLVLMLIVYLVFGITVMLLVSIGRIPHAAPEPTAVDMGTDTDPVPQHTDPAESLRAGIDYVQTHLRRPDGHIDLYQPLHVNQKIPDYNYTNSEAVSYYLLIMAQQGNKTEFDSELGFVEQRMMHPDGDYLMWKLDDMDNATGEERNIAPDADLRALHALYVAKDRWSDSRYDKAIDRLASGLERVAIMKDGTLAAYGGMSGENSTWQASESYLAYSDFQTIDRLANTRGGVWNNVSARMRKITLDAQIWNGLYNTVYLADGQYGNHIDGGVYSINSMWIMVRFAESDDPDLMASANKSLDFYVERYKKDGRLYDAYNSSGGPATESESAWTYALVTRAASALGEKSFAQIMERRLRDFQDLDPQSPQYGAFVEGAQGDERVGQFTMQESILTLQETRGLAQRFQ